MQEVIAELTGIKKVEKTEKQQTQLNSNTQQQQQPPTKRKYTKKITPESIQKENDKIGELVGKLKNENVVIPVTPEDKKETVPFKDNQEEQDNGW